MKDFGEWMERLGIKPSELKESACSLDGTRPYIQAEAVNYTVSLAKTYKPDIETIGITNRCEDGLFILFADYDKIYKKIVYKNLDNLLKECPWLGNFFIAKTEPETICKDGNIKGSYHVVNFSKLPKRTINKLLSRLEVDENYKKIPCKTAHKCHVLRIIEKKSISTGQIIKEAPQFLEIYPNTYAKSQKQWSLAHLKALWKGCGYKDLYFDQRKWDKSKIVELHKYSTISQKART